MTVLYEDNHIIIVNKTASEIVQGDKTGDTPLSEIVKQYLKEKYQKPGNVFIGVTHRLDRPVSGLVVFAKTSKALGRLNEMFRVGEVKKTYWAIVKNMPPEPEGELVHYLVRNEKQNKSYAYDYILDKLNCRDQQARQQKALDDVRRQMSAAQAEGLVDALPDYYIQKCYLTDYEREIARMLGLGLASDSLKQVAVRLQTIDFRLPKPEITERYFLDYEPVQFVAGRYTYKKPIPDCPVYEHGVIYRILLGEYKYKQNISIFRSASPLYVLKTDAGRYRYFAGGFATKAEAVDAQELLRAKGFRRPELVVWYDGEYTNLTRTPEAEMAAFRVEISSEQNLSDTVKQAIAQAAPGCDLSRVGADLFVVGQFDNKAVADQAAAAIRAADPQLSVKVTEIAK